MAEDTYQQVQSHYGDIARRTRVTVHDKEDEIALAFGYNAKDLRALPDKANLGLSCGNPVAYGNIKQGETIVDLGSGGGIDVLLAARKVGPEGNAIGIDMTKDMIDLAKRNAEAAGLSNTRFIEASITSIPLPDASVDCIISNCVINLIPSRDKPSVFQEIARLLKPGGRLAISDILARKELPPKIVNDIALHVGCIAGASQVAEYEEYLKRAGFKEILMVDTKADLNLYKQSSYLGQSSCCGPAEPRKEWPTEFAELDFNEWVGKFHPSQYWLNEALMICVASFQIYAVKHSAVEQAMS
ncbi:arsenic methyltransferase Cyt19, putative [Aspergillus fumigatus A1163]|uniref:Arsenite methyltransferase n=2 Tax=Aspergillus fumigatus TaxID=746128 RepID=Q4WWA9_ASPFU|nr:arsenic methyltransferase Cyt19, putative [Aspergillus fumigatus Af293]EAL91117.1 arsenic methyltransferase Cyt19, putative [Aspergillus fumigatus Af293]EDP49880.1 arsenic methyltransferase Cyt19, putative [Aspergillus fumigatus A1163]